jgi:UDP:flavonoid glycosyltransferase YjiC (YdhE family)
MRVALVAGPDPGHLIPCAGLAVALRAAGHEVVVVTGERWHAALGRSGLPLLPLPLLAPTAADGDLSHRLHVRPIQMGLQLAPSLRGVDLVVVDTLTRAGVIAATVLEVPWVELIPHPLPDPSVALPPFGTGWTPRPRRDRPLRRRTAASVALGLRQRHAALAAAGLADAAPAHRLVSTLPALEPARPDWPASATVVAPLTWESAEVDLAIPPGTDPVMLVVGSTASGGRAVDLLGAVGGWAGGWRVVSPRFGGVASAGVGPGRLAPLLAAADVVVAAGGHGMVAAAMRAGVPMVLSPGAGDQKEVAARAARAGSAVVLRRLRRRAFRRALAEACALVVEPVDVSTLPDPVPLVVAAARRAAAP